MQCVQSNQGCLLPDLYTPLLSALQFSVCFLKFYRDNSTKPKFSTSKTITNRRDTNEPKTVHSETGDKITHDKYNKASKDGDKLIVKLKRHEKENVSKDIQIPKEPDKVHGNLKSNVLIPSVQDLPKKPVQDVLISKENEKMNMILFGPDPEDLERESVQEPQISEENDNINKTSSASTVKHPEKETFRKIQVAAEDSNKKTEVTNVNVQIMSEQQNSASEQTNATVLNVNESEKGIHEKDCSVIENQDNHFANVDESPEKNDNAEKGELTNKTDKTNKNVFENKPKAKARIEDVTTKLIKRLEESKTVNASGEAETDTNEIAMDTVLRDLVRTAISDLGIENVYDMKKTDEICDNVPNEQEKKLKASSSTFPDNTEVASTCDNVENSTKCHTAEVTEHMEQPNPEINSNSCS